MRYFLELSYKGTAYNGWQRQENAPSLQETLELSLSKLLGKDTTLTGAGRTDSGVHASFYVSHFDCTDVIKDPVSFVYHLNAILPHDISTSKVYSVSDESHSRFDADSREYKYFILPHKDPFTRDLIWQYYQKLDIVSMNIAASSLLRYTDFTTFSKLHSSNRTNICHITHAEWVRDETNKLTFTIRSDRFLRNMIRAIVGAMVDVGRGKITAEQFEQMLASQDLSKARGSAPAKGLYLSNITYPKSIKSQNTPI